MWFCYFLLSIGVLQVQAEKRQQVLTEKFNEESELESVTQQFGSLTTPSKEKDERAPGGDASIKIIGTGKIAKNGKTSLNINVQIGGNEFPTEGGQYPQPTQGPITGTPPPGIPTSGPEIPTGGATTETPGGGAPGEFTGDELAGLAKHNEFREVHQAPPMTLDRQMCDQAQAYAEELRSMGKLKHSSDSEGEGQGENLSMGCSSEAPQHVLTAVENWYNEVCDPGYDFNNGGFSRGTGHFTQVVWKGSTVLGIGRAEGEKNGMKCAYIVGRYKPAGNMMSDFPKNVLKGSFDPSSCESVRSKRKRYFDENGKAVLINFPFTEVDIPAVRNGTIKHPPRPVSGLLNSKKKKKDYVNSRHH